MTKHSENFDLPLPDFGPLPEDGEKNDDFVKSFPVERFPALTDFFKKRFTAKPFAEMQFPQPVVEDFCRNSKPAEIAGLDREFADFLTFTSHTSHAAMQAIVTDRFGANAPRDSWDGGYLRSWIAHYAQKHHGPDWRNQHPDRKENVGLTGD